jgi:hypothetical protein
VCHPNRPGGVAGSGAVIDSGPGRWPVFRRRHGVSGIP